MPTSRQSSAIGSPASRRATNCNLSSITEHSFQGITPSQKGRKCNPCVRYDLLPMSRVAHIYLHARFATLEPYWGLLWGPQSRLVESKHLIPVVVLQLSYGLSL